MARDIKDIVSRSFDQTRDLRIEHTIEQKGAATLLSAVYNANDAEERKFYRVPKLAEGTETKLAILYGETMITPYIIDVGTSNGINDPSSITRTIRFVAGDGETEGVVVGPNGSLLENVYMGTDGETPQPIIDSDGKPSTKDIILGSLLGAVVQSIPAIWDAIFNDTPEADKVGEIDPITGKKLLTKEEKKALEQVTSNISVEQLANVKEDTVGNDFILVYDDCQKLWVPKHITELLADQLEITGGSDGTAGTVGTPGTSGTPAVEATAEVILPADPTVMPDTDLQKDPGAAAQNKTVASMVELIDISALEDNEYFESREALNTTGMTFNFMLNGIGKVEQWADTNAADPDSDFPCLVGDQTGSPTTVDVEVAGTVIVGICLSVLVCNTEFAFYTGTFSTSGDTTDDFSQHTTIMWENTELAALIAQFGDQLASNINIRLRRMDGSTFGGTPQSTYPVQYQGISFIYGETDWELKSGNPGPGGLYPFIDAPAVIADDGVYPDRGPLSSGLGVSTCPAKTGTVIPATPGSPAVPGTAPIPGTAGTPAVAGDITLVATPVALSLIIAAPFSTKYCPDEDGSNNPWVFDNSDLATIASVDGGEGNTEVTVKWSMVRGKGTFITDGALPVSINATLSADAKTYTLVGPAADMPAASLVIKMRAADEATGELNYKITLQNSTAACSGMLLKVMPCSTELLESESACAEITLTGDTADTGSVRIYSTMPDGTTSESTTEKELTSGAVNKTGGQTLNDFVIAVAADMQTNIDAKNGLPLTDATWLPAFIVTVLGATIIVCAPPGEEFNSMTLREDTTGAISIDWLGSILDFFGGVAKNVFNTPSNDTGSTWSLMSDILLGAAGMVAGQVISNMIFNNSSTLSISIPEADADVTLSFLYRGRKVQVPSTYSQATRSGTPDYSAFNGTWITAWTDNPAWCLLDYLDNRKFGMGDDLILTASQRELLLADIFSIAQYCDEVVDGEARFSLNTAITDGTKIQILEQLCSVFFGSYVFYKGGLRIKADREDPVIALLVNQASAGNFTYEHATLKSFINKVIVTYVDPDSFYIEKTVTVENQLGIDKYGEKTAAVFGFGITSETQALRYGNWILQSEIENSLTVSYSGGWDHYRLVPGSIVQFEDSNERGSRLAGRAVVTGSNVVLDGPCSATVGDKISITEDDGTIHETTIAAVTDSTHLTLTAAPTGTVVDNSTFIISDQIINQQLFRVVKVDETEDGVFNTTLQLYNKDKYNKIIATNRS